ncbi:DUF3035 domain-containing protein [Aestuariivita boseongensis]|uniref:DUF3035 domain-containing protein n=1 Tax=Aestuariivita boseongensis TaxID=1470562 RepID=UPI0006813096|nr:DUF3035 domain-containing protein [Aestuariivita boseongensis]
MTLSRIAIVVAVLAVAGCSNQGLRDLRSTGAGPDEFLILPSKPLQPPSNFSELPEPTPGGANLTDPQPKADAIAALGGRPSALVDQGVPSSDAVLVSYASRNGVPENIRETTSAEDEQFRKRRGRLTSIQLFRTDRYNQVYRPQRLDSFAAERRARQSGIPTPTNPPEFQ